MTDIAVPVRIVLKCFVVICLVFAFLLLFWPNLLVKLNGLSKKWVSTDKFEKELNQTRDIDAQLLGIRKVIGIISLVLAFVFILILLK